MYDDTAAQPAPHCHRCHTLIVGAGFGGIAMGIALDRAGVHDYLILEKADDVGGVWRDNAYPGAACDVKSHLYSYSFEPNPEWSHAFARQPEIHEYLRHCARKYGLHNRLRCNTEVTGASFDDLRSLWQVTLADGSSILCENLVSATGQLSKPAYPRVEGLDSFEGPCFHSARWDQDFVPAGKRVAVIGTGASAIQFVPAIVEQGARVTLFQRSATFIKAKPDRPYSAAEKARFRRHPWLMAMHRAWTYIKNEAFALGFIKFPALMQPFVGRPYQRMLKAHVADSRLRRKLTPTDPIGCKRILLSNNYLDAIGGPNVDLVTEGIARVCASGVETRDGQLHQCDALIMGTGFAATEFLSPMIIRGRHGIELSDAWREGAMAYLGMSVPDFPNFFMLYGPNTNLGHNSIVYMIESQVEHIVRCIRTKQRLAAPQIEVCRRPYKAYNDGILKHLTKTVWAGCTSWYIDANGRNSTNWPGFTFTYRWLTRRSIRRTYRFARS